MRAVELALIGCLVWLAACAPTRTLRHSDVVSQLEKAHSEWRGTPYRLGGTTKRGVDCSAFVQITMRDYLRQTVPRSTDTQIRTGKRIRTNQLAPGDLVFFRTGRRTLHVGIYMNEGRFLHASTSSGVMISRLNEPYWSRRFLQARRV